MKLVKFATATLLVALIAFLIFGERPSPNVKPAPAKATLAEMNVGWDRHCARNDCDKLPIGYLSIDLEHGPRLFMPLDPEGNPLQTAWGVPTITAQIAPDGQRIRGHYKTRLYEIRCCDKDLLDGLAISADWPDLGLSPFIKVTGATALQNDLGWHLGGQISPKAGTPIDPATLPQQRLEDFDATFWRVTQTDETNQEPDFEVRYFLSKAPLIVGRHLFAKCGLSDCIFSTLKSQSLQTAKPHIEFRYSETYRMEKSICAKAAVDSKCDPVTETLRRIPQATTILDAVVTQLITHKQRPQ